MSGQDTFCRLFYSYFPKCFSFGCKSDKTISFAIVNLPYTHLISNQSYRSCYFVFDNKTINTIKFSNSFFYCIK